MSTRSSILFGKRILVVEDELLIGLLLEDFLIKWGCVVAGIYDSLAKALEAVKIVEFDLAILDINLGSQKSYPIAKALDSRGIPFLFLSGYGDQALSIEYPMWRVCAKPFSEKGLAENLLAVLTQSRQRSPLPAH